jgi:predicted acylesterase/phospholipase RssA/CRP-like cAMP-binding protein
LASDPLTEGRSRADSLASIPILAAVAAEADSAATPLDAGPWAELAASAEPFRLRAGQWLWRQGDPGDSLSVVLTGRLEVVLERPAPGRVLRVVGRGQAVGELALLTDATRSASVRARRDSELLRVSREAFEALLNERPAFAVALTRVLGRQLREASVASLDQDPVPGTIAVLPTTDGLPVRDVGGYLALLLGRYRSVTRLERPSNGGEPDYGRMLDRAERVNEQVILLADAADPGDPWTSFCERQADRVIVLASEDGRPGRPRPRLRGCELVTLGPGGAGLAPWVSAFEPRNVHLVREASTQGPVIEALARRLAGRSIGLVLSGGGARAFAHVGVLEELLSAGLTIDRVGGTSGGAFVGGQFAMGRSPEQILRSCYQEFLERSPMDDYTLPLVALTRGRKGIDMVKRTFGATIIEELDRDFFCVSADMITSELVVHRRGLLAEAVAASMTLPGVFPPRPYGDRLLLDGGLLNNLPVDVMAAEGEGPVVACDVSARFDPPARRRPPSQATLLGRLRAWLVGTAVPMPTFSETIIRSIVLGSVDTAEHAQRHADLVIEPRV